MPTEDRRFCTYVHLRPDGRPFYVGKGLRKRASQLRASRNIFHQNIVNKYGAQNIAIRIVKRGLLESEAFAHEIEAIACLRDFGYELTNGTLGGEGYSGGYVSPEIRAASSIRFKGNKWRVGKKDSPETRALKSAVLMGNKRRQGVLLSDAVKEEKRQLMLTRNPMNSPVSRERQKARTNDPEVRARRSASMKIAWQKRRMS